MPRNFYLLATIAGTFYRALFAYIVQVPPGV